VVGDPWSVLGIARTTDTRAIRRAYAARLRHVHPEDDAEGFQELREAYETAVAMARWQGEQEDRRTTDDAGPVDASVVPRRRRRLPAPALASTREAESLSSLTFRLAADPDQRASVEAWRDLLSSESLWNVDARQAFEAHLIGRILGGDLVLPPEVGQLLQREFHWTEEALSLHPTLPPGAAEALLERLARAPIDFAHRLCEEGRYDEARALLQPISKAPSRLSRPARRLLARCDAEEAANALIAEVRQLRANEGDWTRTTPWLELLDRPPLRQAETKNAFQRRLFTFLGQHGQKLSGAVWALLEDRYHWSREVPPDDLARAAKVLGPAIVEAIDDPSAALSHAQVIGRLVHVVAHIEGQAGERARQLFDASCRAALERADELARLDRPQEAIREAAPVARAGERSPAVRARDLIERLGRATLGEAERLRTKRRPDDARALLAPVVAHLPPDLALEARLVLAGSHLDDGSYARAEQPLDEALREDPASLPALLLLSKVKEDSGQLELAAAVCLRALAVDPGNDEAQGRLERLQQEHQADVARTARQAPRWGGPLYWIICLVIWVAINRACGFGSDLTERFDIGDLAPVVIVPVGILALVLMAVSEWRGGRASLRLDGDAEPPSPSRRWLVLGIAAFVVAVMVAVVALYWNPDATRQAGTSSARRFAPAMDVSILDVGPEGLPLRRGHVVRLSVRARYTLLDGGGSLRLFAHARPGGRLVEVSSMHVNGPSGTVRLAGRYTVPDDAAVVDIHVSVSSSPSPRTARSDTMALAVE